MIFFVIQNYFLILLPLASKITSMSTNNIYTYIEYRKRKKPSNKIVICFFPLQKGKEMKRKIMILCLLWFEGRSFFFAPLSIAKKIYKP
jgi:hypothetical protein